MFEIYYLLVPSNVSSKIVLTSDIDTNSHKPGSKTSNKNTKTYMGRDKKKSLYIEFYYIF